MPDYVTRLEVRIAGALRQGIAASSTTSTNAGVAVCAATIANDGEVTPGALLEIRMGFGGTLDWVFRGEIEDRGVAYYPTEIQIAGVGFLYRARRKTSRVDAECMGIPDPDDPPQEQIAYCAIGMTDEAIVADLLALAGITAHDLEGTGEPLTTIRSVQLPTGGSPWTLIQEIDKRTWYRTFDSGDGTVIRRPYTVLPSVDAALTLTEGVDLYEGRKTSSRAGMVSNVHVKGASYIGADDLPIVIEFATDEPETNEYGVNDVLEWTSELFETEAQAEEWATTALGEFGKLQERVTFTLGKGETRLKAGMTVAIVSGTFGYGSGSRWLVEEVRHYTDGAEFLTAAIFRGSAEPTGTSLNQRPIAQIVYVLELEYLADGSKLYVVSLDGSGSYDTDGVIASYAWSGDPSTPVPIGDGARATVTYAGDLPGDATVTLEVMDDQGKIGTRTIPIVASAFVPVLVRDLWAAVESDLLLSINGQRTWHAIPIEAVTLAAQAGLTYNLVADGDGELYRVLLDQTFTTVLAGAGITAVFISQDAAGTFTGVCYAGASDGTVYRSVDHGLTWSARNAAAPLAGAVAEIAESPFADGQVKAIAGNKLYQSYDAGANFGAVYTHPDVAAVAHGLAGGFDRNYSGFAVGGAGAVRLREWDDAATVALPPADDLSLPYAVTMAIESPILWIVGNAPDGGASWEADAQAGGVAVRKTWDHAAHGIPLHAIRDGRIEGLIYVAADHLVKTPDGFATTLLMHTLTGAQTGRRIGFGDLHELVPPSGDLIFLAARGTDECHLIRLTGDGWEDAGTVGMAGSHTAGVQYHRLVRIADGTLFAWHFPRDGIGSWGVRRSTDNGDTWADVADLTDAIDIEESIGVLYCWGNRYSGSPSVRARILSSTDSGATWAEVANYPFHNGGSAENVRLAADPGDPLRLVMMHINGPRVSADGGATFGAAAYGGGIMGGNGDLGWPIAIAATNHYAYGYLDTLRGGTISPLVYLPELLASPSGPLQGFRFTTTLTYGLAQDGGGLIAKTVDGGASWALETAYGSVSGIARKADTGDIYVTWRVAAGDGVTTDYTGLIRKQAGGAGALADLTQGMFEALGDLWVPFALSVTIGAGDE